MNKKLLFTVTRKDLDIQTFCSGGPGGQHQNKTASGVRIVHKESGAVGESRTQRSQSQNKKIALQNLAKSTKFKIFLNRKVNEVIQGKTIEQKVEEALQVKTLKYEVKDEHDRWIEIPFEKIGQLE